MIVRTLSEARQALAILRQWKIYHIFLARAYQRHTIARLEHLDHLGLDLRGKRIFEIGAGSGEHTLFYLHRGCHILPTDARPELVAFLRQRFGLPAEQLDVETQLHRLPSFGHFDYLHCYGLLYHIANPQEVIQHTAPIVNHAIIETCVAPDNHPDLTTFRENRDNLWEAAHGTGCHPTRPWLFQTLKQSYAHVYCPTTQPHHEEFPTNWENPAIPPTGLIRAIFIASHTPLDNPRLTEELLTHYEPW